VDDNRKNICYYLFSYLFSCRPNVERRQLKEEFARKRAYELHVFQIGFSIATALQRSRRIFDGDASTQLFSSILVCVAICPPHPTSSLGYLATSLLSDECLDVNQIEYLTYLMSTYNNSSKFVGKHQADGVKRIQANEETNDTSSGDDPEEPTDGRRDESKVSHGPRF